MERIEQIESLLQQYDKIEKQITKLENEITDKLKKSILQYAIEGKLVKQDPNDEPASVLLERIKAEKEKLLKEGKIKRDKNESYIYQGDDKNYYEKNTNNEIKLVEKVSFAIPNNWVWQYLQNIVEINPINKLPDDTNVGFIPMNLIEAQWSNQFSYIKKLWKQVKSGFTHVSNNDIIFAKITPCFQNRKSAILDNLPSGYGAATTEVHVLRNHSLFNIKYLFYFIKTEYFVQYGIKHFTGTAGQQRFGTKALKDTYIPLPPLAEQQRIVNKIERLFNVL